MKSSVRDLRSILLALIAGLALAPALAAPSYRYVVASATLTDLGTPGTPSFATDINNRGSIVGYFLVPSGNQRAFYIPAGGPMHNFTDPLNPLWSMAHGINSSDTVVGTIHGEDGMHAFWFTGAGSTQLLGDASPFGLRILSGAVAVADSGYVVGQRHYTMIGYQEATIWSGNNTFDALENTFPYDTIVVDVNTHGVAVGRSLVDSRARRWSFGPQAGTQLIPPVAGGIGDITARGINSHGHVVGNDCCAPAGSSSMTSQAMFWNGVGATSVGLGVLPGGKNSDAEDINDGGFIVGSGDLHIIPWSPQFPGAIERLAYLYHPDFGMYVLPSPPVPFGMTDCRAVALNERKSSGQVQVVGSCHDGVEIHAVRWDVDVQYVRIRPFPPFGPSP